MLRAPATYQEFPPCEALRPWVVCYWRFVAAADGGKPEQRVLPDGSLDILFHLSPIASSFVVGTMTVPITVSVDQYVDILGVRFRPGRAPGFLGLPAAELTDRSADLEQVWLRGARTLEERLQESTGIGGPIRVLEQELLDRLPGAASWTTGLERVFEHVVDCAGAITVGRLSELAGLSRQQLARRFPAAIGLTPKMFCRVIRFNAVVRRVSAAKTPFSWAEIAADAGYYDQAHLIADFKQFSGMTPTQGFS